MSSFAAQQQRLQEIRSLPRLLEQVLLNSSRDELRSFAAEHCTDDCIFELEFSYGSQPIGDDFFTLPTPTAKKSMTLQLVQMISYLVRMNEAIPDALFLIHDSQIVAKGTTSYQLTCKFSFSGLAIFEFDSDNLPLLSISQPPSPRLAAQMSANLTALEAAALNDPVDPRTISFTRSVSTHSNDVFKRKFSTVGRYVDSSHLDDAYEVIKRSSDMYVGSGRGATRKYSFSSTSTMGQGMMGGIDEPKESMEDYALTVEEPMQRDRVTPAPQVKVEADALPSLKQGSSSSSMYYIKEEALSIETTTTETFHHERGLYRDITGGLTSSDSFGASSDSSKQTAGLSIAGNPPNLSTSTTSSSFIPRRVKSAGVVKMAVNADTARVARMDCTIYCTSGSGEERL